MTTDLTPDKTSAKISAKKQGVCGGRVVASVTASGYALNTIL